MWGIPLFRNREPLGGRSPTVNLWIGDPPLRRARKPFCSDLKRVYLVGVAVVVNIACWGRFGSCRSLSISIQQTLFRLTLTSNPASPLAVPLNLLQLSGYTTRTTLNVLRFNLSRVLMV